MLSLHFNHRNPKGDLNNQQTNVSFSSVPNFGGSSTSLLKSNNIVNGKVHPTVPAKMPKYIQMGTGFPPTIPPALSSSLTASSSQHSDAVFSQQVNEGDTTVSQPDLLSDHNKLDRYNSR